MAGTTNFLPWNPNATNQETDAQYLADSQRAAGAVNDTPLPAPLGNKAFYQWSTFCAAFGQMMANKPGAYSLNDADINVLSSVLSNILTESDMGTPIVSVPYSPTPVFNAGSSNGFQMLLTGNITSCTITGVTPGQLVAFYFIQDSVGGRTVAWPLSVIGGGQPNPAPNSESLFLFRADLSGNLICLTANSYSGSNSNGYWTKDASGKIEQWCANVTGAGGGSTVPFPIPFTNPASIVVTYMIWNIDEYTGLVAVTTTGFEPAVIALGDGPLWWRAIGY